MRYELHFAEKEILGDIPCYKEYNQQDLIVLLNTKKMLGQFKKHENVYLCAIENSLLDEDGIILVDDNPENIISFIRDNTNTPTMKKIFLQVYSSYEEAYEVALDMKEVNPLCYS